MGAKDPMTGQTATGGDTARTDRTDTPTIQHGIEASSAEEQELIQLRKDVAKL